MMEKYNKLLGDIGEGIAVSYLKKNKYKIIEQKYVAGKGEIDIIALKKKVTVFVEVKTRQDKSFGYASEAVNFKKRKKLIETANRYILERDPKTAFRFDVIEVYGKMLNGEFCFEKIEHIENAFGVN